MMTDPAEIRAEGRRLREACESPVNSDPTWITATDVFGKWVWDNLDALLADPAPSDEVAYLRDLNRQMGAKLDRLSAAPVGLTEVLERIMVEANKGLNVYSRQDEIARDGQFRYIIGIARDALDRLSAAPVDDRERLAELEDWLLSAEHHAGCSGEYKKPDGSWAYRCKCGLRELRDERPVSPSVDPEEKP